MIDYRLHPAFDSVLPDDLDDFTRGYIGAAEFLLPEPTEEDEGPGWDEATGWAPEALDAMRADCERFQRENRADLDAFCGSADDGTESLAGYCFWMNRNGHGTGFWDRGAGDVGDRLSAACERWSECDCYVGDDRQVYVS